jgi:hypothetical protein
LKHTRLSHNNIIQLFKLPPQGEHVIATTVSVVMTCRRRIEFGLVDYPNSDISDEDLSEMIREFRQDNPDVGASMAAGLLRARGYRVVRVRDALRNSDPLSAALRWPGGITRRRVYFVAGPNSLWHIGKCFMGYRY